MLAHRKQEWSMGCRVVLKNTGGALSTEAQNRRGKQKLRSVAHIVDLHINRAVVAAAAAEPVADRRDEGLRNVRAERAEPRSKFCPGGGLSHVGLCLWPKFSSPAAHYGWPTPGWKVVLDR